MLSLPYILSIRGAITVEENCCDSIKQSTLELLNTILEENKLIVEDVSFVIFTMTNDLTKSYPAKFVRESISGFDNVCMMCVQELYVEDSLKMCIRVLIVLKSQQSRQLKHVYLRGAKVLRPDL